MGKRIIPLCGTMRIFFCDRTPFLTMVLFGLSGQQRGPHRGRIREGRQVQSSFSCWELYKGELTVTWTGCQDVVDDVIYSVASATQ